MAQKFASNRAKFFARKPAISTRKTKTNGASLRAQVARLDDFAKAHQVARHAVETQARELVNLKTRRDAQAATAPGRNPMPVPASAIADSAIAESLRNAALQRNSASLRDYIRHKAAEGAVSKLEPRDTALVTFAESLLQWLAPSPQKPATGGAPTGASEVGARLEKSLRGRPLLLMSKVKSGSVLLKSDAISSTRVVKVIQHG